jgi:hypothetical protein
MTRHLWGNFLEPSIALSGCSSTRLRRRTLRFLVGLILLVSLTEIGLRAVLGLGNPILYREDPSYGYFPRPNQKTRRLFARTKINSRGMRCAEFAPEKPYGTLRIMFLGDSITYGTTQVDQDDIFAEQIRKKLSIEINRPVEEINASANAWAISNEYGFLRSNGTLSSDYVVVVLNSGDLPQRFSTLSDVQGGLALQHGTAIGELLTRLWLFRKQDAGTLAIEDSGTELANLRYLTNMVNLARFQGSEFVLVFVPFRRDVVSGVARSVPVALEKWAKSKGVELIDLTAVVSGYETTTITLRDGVHFNKRGNQLIADSLGKRFADEYASRNRGFTDRPVKLSRVGNQ